MATFTRFAVAAMGTLVATCCSAVHAAQTCDRDCLLGVADRYLAAIAAHDPAKAPLAANIRFVENVKRLKPGEGIWAAAAGKATAFRIYVPDPDQGSIGLITVIDRKACERRGASAARRAPENRGRQDHRGRAPGRRRAGRRRCRARSKRRARISWPSCRERERMPRAELAQDRGLVLRRARRQRRQARAVRSGLPARGERADHGRAGAAAGAARERRRARPLAAAARARLHRADELAPLRLRRHDRPPARVRRRSGAGARDGALALSPVDETRARNR